MLSLSHSSTQFCAFSSRARRGTRSGVITRRRVVNPRVRVRIRASDTTRLGAARTSPIKPYSALWLATDVLRVQPGHGGRRRGAVFGAVMRPEEDKGIQARDGRAEPGEGGSAPRSLEQTALAIRPAQTEQKHRYAPCDERPR